MDELKANKHGDIEKVVKPNAVGVWKHADFFPPICRRLLSDFFFKFLLLDIFFLFFLPIIQRATKGRVQPFFTSFSDWLLRNQHGMLIRLLLIWIELNWIVLFHIHIGRRRRERKHNFDWMRLATIKRTDSVEEPTETDDKSVKRRSCCDRSRRLEFVKVCTLTTSYYTDVFQ